MASASTEQQNKKADTEVFSFVSSAPLIGLDKVFHKAHLPLNNLFVFLSGIRNQEVGALGGVIDNKHTRWRQS